MWNIKYYLLQKAVVSLVYFESHSMKTTSKKRSCCSSRCCSKFSTTSYATQPDSLSFIFLVNMLQQTELLFYHPDITSNFPSPRFTTLTASLPDKKGTHAIWIITALYAAIYPVASMHSSQLVIPLIFYPLRESCLHDAGIADNNGKTVLKYPLSRTE